MPTIDLENNIRTKMGFRMIAGLDEAGRGAIAGPIVAAAVILPVDQPKRLKAFEEVNDSKKLSARSREELFEIIMKHAISYGIASIAAQEIDQIGISPANKAAMRQAVQQLHPHPDFLMIDGRIRLGQLPIPQQSIVRGDSLSYSIAAASILAKVSRDRIMQDLDSVYPGYLFAKHKGYCTRQHQTLVAQIGPSPVHRHSFAPIRQTLV
jgi:ribonuclease HII